MKKIISIMIVGTILLSLFSAIGVSAEEKTSGYINSAEDNSEQQSDRAEAKEYLRIAIEKAYNELPIGGAWTNESWEVYEKALSNANNLYDNNNSTAEQLIKAADELLEAFDNLEPFHGDKAELWALIEKLDEILTKEDAKSLPNYNELRDLVMEARVKYYYAGSQEELDECRDKLKAVLIGLGEIESTAPTTEQATENVQPTTEKKETNNDNKYSPEFTKAIYEYGQQVGIYLDINNIEPGSAHINIYREKDGIIFFTINRAIPYSKSIELGGYIFVNNGFYSENDIDGGFCVYYNDFVCKISDAVQMNITTYDELAEIFGAEKIENTDIQESTPSTTMENSIRHKLMMLVSEYSFGIVEMEECYTPESFSVFRKAYDNANKLLIGESSTDEQLEGAYTELVNAKNSLVSANNATSESTSSETTDPISSEETTDLPETTEPTTETGEPTTESTEPTTENIEPTTESTQTTEPSETVHPTTSSTEKNPDPTAPKAAVKKAAVKKSNPINVTAKTKTVKSKKLKKGKVCVKAIIVKKAKGEVKYSKVSGSKKLTVNKTTGKIKIKKGTKKGTYTIKVKVTAKGTKNYKQKTVTKTVKIKVK